MGQFSSDNSHDRDQQILSRLAKIEHKVDSLERTTSFALRAESQKLLGSIREIFRRGGRRAQVYLAADGQRTVQEIARHLGMQQTNVSRELQALGQEGLLELIGLNGGAKIWGKTAIDRTLRISRFLCAEYRLDRNGKPVVAKKAK